MEIVRKPDRVATALITVRVKTVTKDDLTRARKIGDKQNLDMTAMIDAALADVATSVLRSTAKATSNGAPHDGA